ncbi:hypothetical protein [Pendulispora albinea]|uniref:Uncharacterized protein n=1 Tax=Pendulispora albinea TaxID=2741071 RepID=A0ABZ2LLI3_9BACT
MKLVFLFVSLVLCACNVADPDAGEESSLEDKAELMSLQCSFGCSSGFHPVSFSCNFNCPGSCTAGYNQTDCQPNTGSSFYSCSLGCPSGYRPVSLSYNPSCRTSPASGSSNNQTLCVL